MDLAPSLFFSLVSLCFYLVDGVGNGLLKLVLGLVWIPFNF